MNDLVTMYNESDLCVCMRVRADAGVLSSCVDVCARHVCAQKYLHTVLLSM